MLGYKRLLPGSLNVEPISHKTFLYAFHVLENLYGGGKQNMIEITMADDGVVIFDGGMPVGVLLVNFHPISLEYPLVIDCCVLDGYKGTKWSIRLMRELKRIITSEAYYFRYAGSESSYRGENDSIKAIVASRKIGEKGGYTLVRNQ